MPKFPLKRGDRYINRSATTTAVVTAMVPQTATAMWSEMATVIDVYGLRWEYTDGVWREWHFLSRRIER